MRASISTLRLRVVERRNQVRGDLQPIGEVGDDQRVRADRPAPCREPIARIFMSAGPACLRPS
jgi:hypothetical protein